MIVSAGGLEQALADLAQAQQEYDEIVAVGAQVGQATVDRYAKAVEDARARGADLVLIGARPADSPRHIYASMGFRPLCVTRSYLKTLGAGGRTSEGAIESR